MLQRVKTLSVEVEESVAKSKDEPMSPLARLLQERAWSGVSYREMERIVARHGITFGSSSFEQVSKDQRADRLTAVAVRAVAIILKMSPTEVVILDDQRWGFTHSALQRALTNEDRVLANCSTEKLLRELATRTAVSQ